MTTRPLAREMVCVAIVEHVHVMEPLGLIAIIVLKTILDKIALFVCILNWEFIVIFPQFVLPKLPVVVMDHVLLMVIVIVFLAMIKTLHVNSVQLIFMALLAIAV